ncbi:hypothetical protein I553_6846 [Mycobacterium xenopi 4042]|uniref:Uncharacterized protein n=1 Tax=Mycobacterium xenopi 4042 TaxID=1299334 RepID=X7Z2N8_MYCXE|nr:hypothetical protein I553_6846 [Mycobacterium xenopi 4042]
MLTRYWDDPQPWTLETYRRHDGYRALQKALDMEPDAVLQTVKDSGLRAAAARAFRRDQVVVHPARRPRPRRQAALPRRQRRRIRARHVQGHPPDVHHSARSHRGQHHRRLCDSGQPCVHLPAR